jgi:hypothetical protein
VAAPPPHTNSYRQLAMPKMHKWDAPILNFEF